MDAAIDQRLKRLVEVCTKDRELFEAAVRVLMCTVELEDKLMRRRRVLGTAKLSRTLSAPAPKGGAASGGGSNDEDERPLLVAFEIVGGGVMYVTDRGHGVLAAARERGADEVAVEVYSPPYRLPGSTSIAIERTEPGWILVVGGTPPQVAVPVRCEEHVRVLLQLLELRGVKPEVR